MSLRIRARALIDGSGSEPLRPATVIIDGKQIVSVSRDQAGAAQNDEILELDDLTILPGLIDGHAHLALIDSSPEDVALPTAEVAVRIFRNCELALDAGFTTVRDLGGLDGGVKHVVDSGKIRGPRIFPSGPAMAQHAGHGTLMPPYAGHYHPRSIPGLAHGVNVCDGEQECRRMSRACFRLGATQLKAMISGGVVSLTDSVEDTQFSVHELRVMVEEAAARNTYVTGHAMNSRCIRLGLEAGLACFEHGTFLDSETAAAMAEAGAALVPTLAVCRLMTTEWERWGLPPEVVPRMADTEAAESESAKLAQKMGVLIGSGSDLLGPEQNRRGLEITLKAQILGPMAAIVAATSSMAQIMRIGDRLGSLAPGMVADLIAVDGDPLTEPGLFDDPARVKVVIKDGIVEKDAR